MFVAPVREHLPSILANLRGFVVFSSKAPDLFSDVPAEDSRKGGARGSERSRSGQRETGPSPGMQAQSDYTAADIEVLEGLEPVRRRPGMYIGGTDGAALHHLFAEVLDNAMDEAVAGHATCIDVQLLASNTLCVRDNGRGIPVDPHPKFPTKSALEVIMTTLHAGGKFEGKAYQTSGGLHGVGVSVVNALSEKLSVEVVRDRQIYRQEFSRGLPLGPLQTGGVVQNRRGTTLVFTPDPEIFKEQVCFQPERLFALTRSKAYLFGGVTLRWSCAAELLEKNSKTPQSSVFHFPNGLRDHLSEILETESMGEPLLPELFCGKTDPGPTGERVEWALAWRTKGGFLRSYCNTIPTPEGGTHESGFRLALLRSLKAYGELSGNKKKVASLSTEDLNGCCAALLSVFISEPEFAGQTKARLTALRASRLVESAIRDSFDHWLAASPKDAKLLLEAMIERAQERLQRRQEKEIDRKTPLRRLRLPGKMADCISNEAEGAELFIVEGDSAGGSAKQARNRFNQAVLPLRGKILNSESAGREKVQANQQLKDLVLALGCAPRDRYNEADLRYERVIIMTDADVDGAHIAALLITFFYREFPDLIRKGHLYLAVPPLYRLSHGGRVAYARDDAHKAKLLSTVFSKKAKVEISRFKGLGEMLPSQLRETTMDPARRSLLRVCLPEEDIKTTDLCVAQLMGTKAETRFAFILEHAKFAKDLDL